MGRTGGIRRTKSRRGAARLLGIVAIVVAASVASGAAPSAPAGSTLGQSSPADPSPYASTPPPPPPSAVLVESPDAGIAVTYTDGGGHWGTSTDHTTDGVTWTPWCGPNAWIHCSGGAGGHDPDTTPACVPSQPDVCFRVDEGTIGASRSDDGGATWEREWGLDEEERERVALAVESAYPEYELVSMSLGILDLPTGFVVIEANGMDGIAVRHADGTWERRGFLDSSCCLAEGVEYPPVDLTAPIPAASEQDPAAPPPPADRYAVGVGFATAAWWIAYVVALFGSRTRDEKPSDGRGRTGRALRWAASGLLLAIALAAFGLLSNAATQSIDMAREEALNPPMDDSIGEVLMYPIAFVVLVLAATLSLAARSAAPLRPRWGTSRTWLGAAASAVVAMTVALIAGATAHRSWIVGVATGVALLATLPPVVILSRRAAGRHEAAVAARWRDPWRGEER